MVQRQRQRGGVVLLVVKQGGQVLLTITATARLFITVRVALTLTLSLAVSFDVGLQPPLAAAAVRMNRGCMEPGGARGNVVM